MTRAVALAPVLAELASSLDAWYDSRGPMRPAAQFRELVQTLRLHARGALMLWDDAAYRVVTAEEFNGSKGER